jgi:hypothetical protein
MDAAVAAVTDGKSGIFVETESDGAARSLALRLHKFRQAYEAQAEGTTSQYTYAGLKITPALMDRGCEFAGVNVMLAEDKDWNIKVLE